MGVYQSGAAQCYGYIIPFQGLATDVSVVGGVITIPTPITLKKSNSGSTFVCVDNGDIYVWHETKWYKQ